MRARRGKVNWGLFAHDLCRKPVPTLGSSPSAGFFREQFPPFIKAEYEKWGKVIKSAGIKLD